MNKIQSSTEKWVQKDRRVWITAKTPLPNPSADVFLEAIVAAIEPKQISVHLRQPHQQVISYGSQIYKVAYEDCQKLTYGANDVADMVDLQQLNEPELLFNLKRRYLTELIFTYCGPTLVFINPYAYIDALFNEDCMLKYQNYVFQQSLEYKNLTPHIFGLAAFCLWQLFQNSRNQSIVISGESGAGKTQNTKCCLKFLASLGKNMKTKINQSRSQRSLLLAFSNSLNKTKTNIQGIEDKILGCNEILQAFGNAKTIRNDNSSRFGKLILLLYGQTQVHIRSAFIVSYLLQKSRVVSLSEGERNYHIFYYILRGTSALEKRQYMLTDPINRYKYLNQSTVYDVHGVSDQQKFNQMQTEFAVYFSKQETHCIFKIISVVLNIGNLTFRKQLNRSNQEMAIPINKECLQVVAKLLQIDLAALEHAFQFKTRKTGSSVINSPLRLDEAVALQNSFAKNIYERVFFFLVLKLNEKIEMQKVNLQNESSPAFRKSIGLLDIFGFEVLNNNSLEQFFINFANEKLQQLYVCYIFKEEQNEFLKQGLKEFANDIDFQDNKPVIDLFEQSPLGLFHLINQSSQLNKSDDDLPEIIQKTHPKNKFLSLPKSKRGVFLISHSCSPVAYNTTGFTARNKDEFPQQLLQIIAASNNQIIKAIVLANNNASQPQTNNRSATKKFLGSKFLKQMNKLTEQLYASDCHFVRCIKPNSSKSARNFNSQAVIQSLRYLGVLDSILIRKLGYVYRRPFKEFLKKFFQIQQYAFAFHQFIADKTQQELKQYCHKFLLKYVPDQLAKRQILLGHNKILIKESALNRLQAMAKDKRKKRIQCANRMKRMYKISVFRRQIKSFLSTFKVFKMNMQLLIQNVRLKLREKKCSKIQKQIRKYLMERRLLKIKAQAQKAVVKIASVFRMKKQRRLFFKSRSQIIKIQSNIRSFLAIRAENRQRYCFNLVSYIFEQSWSKIQNFKATLIQKSWKGYVICKKFKTVIEELRCKLRQEKYRQHLINILFKIKYSKFLARLNLYKRPIITLQAIVRGKQARTRYLRMRASTIKIQAAYRKHLNKKFFLGRLWKQYRKNLYEQERLKAKEVGRLGITGIKVRGVKFYQETVTAPIQYYPQQLQYHYARGQPSRQLAQINETILFNQKNTFQIYIGDYDIIGTQSYQGKWLLKYTEIKDQMKRRNEYPVSLTLGQQTTSVISNKDRLYTFSGTQKQEVKRVDVGSAVQMMASGDRCAYLLTQESKMYVWGSNYDQYIDKISQDIVQYSEVPELSRLQISAVFCKGNKRYFIDGQNRIFYYKEPQEGWGEWKLTLFNFGSKNSIKTVAASYHFVLFLNSQGQLYAQGHNYQGELGLGYTSAKQIEQPELISYFTKQNKQSIESISVGLGHAVAKSKLGHVYTWGNNCYRQVTSKNVQYLHTPEPLECIDEGKLKIYQAVAGARATFLLTQNLQTVAVGTSSTFPTQKGIFNVPLQLLKSSSSCKSLAEVKLSTRWIRELSILIVTAIDSNHCKPGIKQDVVSRYSKTLAKQWLEDRVYPEYREWADNILQLSDIRRFKLGGDSPGGKSAKNKKTESQNNLEELKALIQLRKTSAVFKNAALLKTQQISKRLSLIPQEHWSQSDLQQHRYIKENLKYLK